MDNQIPTDIQAEIAILGSLLFDESLIVSAKDQLSAEDFYDHKNKLIYSAFLKLNQEHKNFDITTLISHLKSENTLDAVGGIDYLNHISNTFYSTVNFESYIALVKDTSLKRNTIKTLEKLSLEGYKTPIKANDFLTKIETEVFELSKKKKTSDFSKIDELAKRVKENAEKNAELSGLTGLDTGFANLNKLTSGLQKETLLILAARPAMGKSAMAMNLAVQVAASNKNASAVVAVFSLEMGSEQLVERMIASEGRIHLAKFKKGHFQNDDWRLFNNAANKLSKLNLYFDDSSMVTIADIRSKCRKLASTVGLDFVVIDYLQLIAGDEFGKSKHEEVSKISRNLKLMARELQVPVLALAQLSREVEKRENKRPIMADLRDSGSIEQDADMVMFIYRDDYYNKTSQRLGEADLIIGKNRSGSTDDLRYVFQGKFAKFIDNDLEDGETSNE